MFPQPQQVMDTVNGLVNQAIQGFSSVVPGGTNITSFQLPGMAPKTVALGNQFVSSDELAQYVRALNQHLQGLEQAQQVQQYQTVASAYANNGSTDMMPIILVLLLSGGLTGTGTGTGLFGGSSSTLMLLIVIMMMGGNNGGGSLFGGGDNNSMMMVLVVLLLLGGI